VEEINSVATMANAFQKIGFVMDLMTASMDLMKIKVQSYFLFLNHKTISDQHTFEF